MASASLPPLASLFARKQTLKLVPQLVDDEISVGHDDLDTSWWPGMTMATTCIA
jgi:hypothetical protein